MKNWIHDAQFIDEINDEYLIKNNKIRGFLAKNHYDKLSIVASKGMGKTLLMRHKRKSIESAPSQAGLLLIPKNETSDYVDLPKTPPLSLLADMKQMRFWEVIWKMSIMISCLLNFRHNVSELESKSIQSKLESAKLPNELANSLKLAFSSSKEHYDELRPSDVLHRLLDTDKKQLEAIRKTGYRKIWEIYLKQITSGCFVFIDSFDQALNSTYDDLEIWRSAQCGLLKASWEVSRHNRHVKVFTTIRQEAYASFNDSEKPNILGSILLLEYNKKDLEKIFVSSIKAFTDCKTMEEFIGLKQIYNRYLGRPEKLFDYIHRHIIPTPRWLTMMGEVISNLRTGKVLIKDDKKRKKHNRALANAVNKASSDFALTYLCGEKKLFFKGIEPEDYLKTLSNSVKSNILSQNHISKISKIFQNNNGDSHPFCLLRNLGLLGIISKNSSSTRKYQSFKKPYEFDWNHINILPDDDASAVYLIHPCLHDYLQQSNTKFRHYNIKIGDGQLWTATQEKNLSKQTVRVFVSHAKKDRKSVIDIATTVENYFDDQGVFNDIWLDEWKLRSGAWVQDQMYAGLESSDFLILALSKNSITSKAVKVEWKSKFQEKINYGVDSVFPFIIDDTLFSDMPTYLKNIFTYRYENKEENAIKLARDILFWVENPKV